MALPIERIRELLGPEGDGKTDAQLLLLGVELEAAAGGFYDEIQAAWKRDPESVRWLVHAQQTGEIEDAGSDYDTVEDDHEHTRWLNYQKETGETE